MSNELLSEVILQRRGPLAKVWLAAHYEKKLTKKEIVTTNILKSVEAIVNDGSIPSALRLTGQLLIGIVRIYSRKAKYLLDECNEAKISIQMSFRPGTTNVDLPADQSSALLQQITLSDTVNEIDLLFPPTMMSSLFQSTSTTINLDGRSTVFTTPLKPQQARPQDITLSEPFLPSPEQTRRLEDTILGTLDAPWTDLQLDLGLETSMDIENARRETDEPFFPSPLHQPFPVLEEEWMRSPNISFTETTPVSPARRIDRTKEPKRRKNVRYLDTVTEIAADQFSKQLQSTQDLLRSPMYVPATTPAPKPFLEDLCSTLKRWYPFTLPSPKKPHLESFSPEFPPNSFFPEVPPPSVEDDVWLEEMPPYAEVMDALPPNPLNPPREQPLVISSSTLDRLSTLPTHSKFTFSEFLPSPPTKSRAASLFYDLLIMKTRGWIEVDQKKAYSELHVSLLPSFAHTTATNGS